MIIETPIRNVKSSGSATTRRSYYLARLKCGRERVCCKTKILGSKTALARLTRSGNADQLKSVQALRVLKNERKIQFYIQMRVWCLTASIPAFQAGGTGSNPVTRSIALTANFTKSSIYIIEEIALFLALRICEYIIFDFLIKIIYNIYINQK